MAVHDPGAGVIELECHSDIARLREKGNVAPLGVLQIPRVRGTVPHRIVLLHEDEEAMTVEVQGVVDSDSMGVLVYQEHDPVTSSEAALSFHVSTKTVFFLLSLPDQDS